MDRIEFCFLILHYKDAAMTEQTISSILSLDDLQSYRIVIVDNASPDGSGKCLRNIYKANENICFVETEENQGFSKGNNLGYQFIKDNFVPEFLICANNDVLFVQKEFLNQLKKLYLTVPFYVCGPDIYVPWRDYHANPLDNRSGNHVLSEIEIEIKQLHKLFATCNKFFSLKLFKLYLTQKARNRGFMQKLYKILRRLQNKKDHMYLRENVILSGACLIFDKRFINQADMLFDPETFLYREEHILDVRCHRNHWRTVYDPEMYVYHMHEGNSNLGGLSYKEFCRYLVQKAEYQCAALRIYQKYVEEGKDGYV